MAVKTGSGNKQTPVAKSVADLGALMSAQVGATDVTVKTVAPVTPLPERLQRHPGFADESPITNAAEEAAQSQPLPTHAQEEQISKVEIMASPVTQESTQTSNMNTAPTSQSDTTYNTAASADSAATPEPTTAHTQVHGELDKLLGATTTTPDDIKSAEGLVNYLQGRDGRFKSLVEITKDTVKRVDELEVKIAKLLEGGATRTVQIKTPDWKDQAIDGLVMGTAVGVGVLGVAYAFDAMFGTAPAPAVGEPAIQ